MVDVVEDEVDEVDDVDDVDDVEELDELDEVDDPGSTELVVDDPPGVPFAASVASASTAALTAPVPPLM